MSGQPEQQLLPNEGPLPVLPVEQVLVTPEDVETDHALFQGLGGFKSSIEMVGKEQILADMHRTLLENGAVALVGARRTGKTLLLTRLAERVVEESIIGPDKGLLLWRKRGKAEKGVNGVISLALYNQRTLQNKDSTYANIFPVNKNNLYKDVRLLVTADEIPLFTGSGEERDLRRTLDSLQYLLDLRAAGHIIALGLLQDFRNENFHPSIRSILHRLVGDNIMTNALLRDEDVLKILRPQNKIIFTPLLEEYLLRQTGGHPSLAQDISKKVVTAAFDAQLNAVSLDMNSVLDVLKSYTFPSIFLDVFGDIKKTGIDPLSLRDDPAIDPLYKAMLPRESATVFWQWAEKKLAE